MSTPYSSVVVMDKMAVASSTSSTSGPSPRGDGAAGSDLGGNVNDWTLDWDGDPPQLCVDCAQLTPSIRRRYRGGNYNADASELRAANRVGSVMPMNRYSDLGIRCVRPP